MEKETRRYAFTLLIPLFCLLGTIFASLSAFEIGVGPFKLNLGGDAIDYPRRAEFIDYPICYAIREQKQLAMIVETKETVSKNEFKISIKRVVIEPYAYGFSRDDLPLLSGNLVSEKLIREVYLKYGDDYNNNTATNQNKRPLNGRLASNNREATFELNSISHIRVMENSHFNLPASFSEKMTADFQRFVCQIPHNQYNQEEFSKGEEFNNHPICEAIHGKKQLELINQTTEVISKNEYKITVKKLIVEPYVFGFNQKKQPILSGRIVDEKLVKQTIVKLGEGYKQPDSSLPDSSNETNSSSNNSTLIDITKSSNIRLLDTQQTMPPQSMDTWIKGFAKIMCQISNS